MATIAKEKPVFTVLVRVTVEPEYQSQLLALSEPMIPVFQRLPGFVSLSQHRSVDGTQIVTYMQWRSQADHEACMADPVWDSEAQAFMKAVESSKAVIEVQTFEVTASVEA